MDLDEQLPVVEISDKFTKDKLIQNKENKEVKSKKDLINCLRNYYSATTAAIAVGSTS